MSRSAQPNFLFRPFFSFISLFRFFSPHVCLPLKPQTFHPLPATTTTTNPHPPPSLLLYISPNLEVSHLYSSLTSNGCVSPPFLASSFQTPLCHRSSRCTIFSHVRETCRHPSATFDHCLYWEPSSPCSALGWQGEAGNERMKGRTE